MKTQTEELRIELKSIKHARNLSEETNAFTASLYVEGVRVATCKNEGHGGQTSCSPVGPSGGETWKLLKAAEHWAARLADNTLKVDGKTFQWPMSLEVWIDKQVERDLTRVHLKNLLKDSVVVVKVGGSDDGKIYAYLPGPRWRNVTRESELPENFRKRVADRGEKILNWLPFEEVLDLYLGDPS